MRQYRAIPIDGKDFVYGWYVYRHESDWDGHDKYIHQIHTKEWNEFIEVIPETVGQSTGRKDKNGKEIYYDSDIVEYTFAQACDDHEETTVTGTVVLDLEFTNSLCVKTAGEALYHFTASECRHSIEIIGNIHQNPKLLEQDNA